MLLLLSRRAERARSKFLRKNLKTLKTNTRRPNLQNSQKSDSQTAQVPKICIWLGKVAHFSKPSNFWRHSEPSLARCASAQNERTDAKSSSILRIGCPWPR